MKKSELIKIAKASSIDMSNIEISRSNGTVRIGMKDLNAELANANIQYSEESCEQLPEVEKMIKNYNREAKKLVKAANATSWGMKYGDGTWMYEFGSQPYSTRLALDNID